MNLISPQVDSDGMSFFAIAGIFVIYVFIRSVIFQGGLYWFVKKAAFAMRRRVYRVPFGRGQLRSEVLASLKVMLIDGVMIASLVKYGPAIPWNQNLLLSFAVSFVWFEIWFYVSHRAFHSRALYFIHEQHHVARVTSPFTALSFSLLERIIIIAGGLGGLVLFAQLLPLSAYGISLYLLANYFLNIFGHSNIEVVPPRFLNFSVGRILNTPTYHALHHARYKGHYSLFTPYLDQLFATRFPDYEAVQKRAYQEQGLSSLAERMATAPPVAVISENADRTEDSLRLHNRDCSSNRPYFFSANKVGSVQKLDNRAPELIDPFSPRPHDS